MKKPLAICALALLAVALYAQDAPGAPAGAGVAGGVSMLDVQKYSSMFLNSGGRIDSKHLRVATREDKLTISTFDGDPTVIDTPLEIALLSYSAGLIDARPVQAAEMLPANDPRTAGLKLGAAVLKELTELRFLDPQNAAAIVRYEGMLQFISDKNGVSRAETDNYYRQGISGLIAGVVDEEFGRILFMLDRKYNVVLARNARNQYVLSYEDVEYVVKELSASTLDALLSAMSRSGDFSQSATDTVRAQAAQIPAVVFARAGNDSLDVLRNCVIITCSIISFAPCSSNSQKAEFG